MEWLQQAPDSFTVGLLVGLVLGLAFRFGMQLLSAVAVLVVIFELLKASGAL